MNTIPNMLTFLRILSIPFLVLCFYLPFPWGNAAAATIFALAAITDWFDGYLARSLGQVSKLGIFLDPVADKLIVAVALVILVGEHYFPFLAIPAAVIVGREIVVSALREWMAEMGNRASVAVSYIGKVKTTLQMVSITMLLAYKPGMDWIGGMGYVLMYVSAVLTLWSMIMYLQVAWPELRR